MTGFTPSEPERQEANAALERSKSILRAVLAQGPEVTRLSSTLRAANVRNHFAEKIEESMRRAK